MGRTTPATKGNSMTTLNGRTPGSPPWPPAEPLPDWEREFLERQAADGGGQAETPPDDTGQSRTRRVTTVVASHRGWLAAVPIVLVNAVAFCGQLSFLRVHLPWPLGGQVLVAVTLESVAVYLAWQAHLALTAGDSALRLRLAAYGFALVIGVMNYSHWMAAGWRPTFAAVTFGLMSVSSPWLWSVHSRRVSRDALLATGDLEKHAVRLGVTRWLWHPVRSVRVMSWATWHGVTRPGEAITGRFPEPPAPVLVAGGDMGGDSEAVTVSLVSPAPAKPVTVKARLTVAEEAARDGVTVNAVRQRRLRAKKRSTT